MKMIPNMLWANNLRPVRRQIVQFTPSSDPLKEELIEIVVDWYAKPIEDNIISILFTE